MIQGVYVFVIFVCKRNVYKLVFHPNSPQGRVLSNLRSRSINRGSGGGGSGAKTGSGNNKKGGRPSTSSSQGHTQDTGIPLSTYRDATEASVDSSVAS